MWRSAKVAVIVPAHDEQALIGRTLRGIPDWVDSVVVVDDGSTDATADLVCSLGEARISCLRHDLRRGVGAALVTGYTHALANGADVLVVMAGDNQMDPEDLPALIAPVVEQRADYAKGNRFVHPRARDMPLLRRWGGRLLSALTRTATGLGVSDTQCGYTALARTAAERLRLSELWPGYGYPNDLLGMLAGAGCSVVEVAVRPVYAGERSGLRPWHLATIGGVVLRRWRRERERRGKERARPERVSDAHHDDQKAAGERPALQQVHPGRADPA